MATPSDNGDGDKLRRAAASAVLQAAYFGRCVRHLAAIGLRPMPDAGIIVDIEVVTGEESDFARMAERLDALEITLGRRPGTVTADRAYGIGKVYKTLSDRDIQAVIPPRPSTRQASARQARAKGFPTRRFRYDAKHDIVRCPRKKVMTPRSGTKSGRWFRADPDACRTCPLRAQCIPDDGPTRRVHITKHYVDVLRARRKRLAWGHAETRLYARHRWWVEGAHGLAKTLHGMARAARRRPSGSNRWRRDGRPSRT